jgi:biotin carboxylase
MSNFERRKKLMILGAGPFQVPGIRKAVELGYYVISVDDRPHNIGHKFSHQYLNCSTTERENLAHQAEELAIDGICTFSSDVAVPSVGYVCDRLRLPGVSLATARRMSTKHLFREAQQQANLPHPRFVAGQSLDELPTLVGALRFPVVVKPVDSSGSRGVRLLTHRSVSELGSAFSVAQRFSASGVVCVEEFVEAKEFGGDGTLSGGQLAFVAITEKHLADFVVTGHSLPSTLSQDDRRRVRLAIEDCCRAVGYCEGPVNFDVKVSPECVIVLEMSARNGGNGIPAVIKRATDVDVEEATIRLAVSDMLQLPESKDPMRGAASLVFGSRSGGILGQISDFADVKAAVPELVELNLAVPLGGSVEPFQHNGNLIGYAVFDCEPAGQYAEIAARIESALDIRVDPS